MKTIATIIAVAAVAVPLGSASAQYARRPAPGAFVDVVPFAGSDVTMSGPGAYVGGYDTSRVYGNGFDGQGRLAPHINGIF